jgi:hypothetical protein
MTKEERLKKLNALIELSKEISQTTDSKSVAKRFLEAGAISKETYRRLIK